MASRLSTSRYSGSVVTTWLGVNRGQGIKVAVVDSGIDYTHPAFAGTKITMTDVVTLERDGQGIILDPSDPIDGPITVTNGYDPMDYTGHGTGMISIIAATDPVSDAWGIAYEAEIVSVKVKHLAEMENARQVFTGTLGPHSTTVIDFDILTSTNILTSASPDDVLDVILVWEGWSNLDLEVMSPTPTITYTADQGGSYFTATTNIPLRARYGRWQARLTNLGSGACSFNLAVKQWEWIIASRAVEKAIDTAVSYDVDVINLSLSSNSGIDVAIERAVKEGVTVATAAGNVSSTLSSWSRYGVTVGATDDTDTLKDWSARGPAPDGNTKPDVVAPGDYIQVAASQHSFGEQNGKYTHIWGTSPAAAHVSGGAALLIQYLRETTGQSPSPALIKTILMGTAVNVGVNGPPSHPGELKWSKDNNSGAGRIDLYRALLSFFFTGIGPTEDTDRDDEVKLHVPAHLPRVPLTSLKGTLYWDEAPLSKFMIWGGDEYTYTYDTATSVYPTPTPGATSPFFVHQWSPNDYAGHAWHLVTTYPPIPQTIDDQFVHGYFYTNTVIPSSSLDSVYTLTVPAMPESYAVRVVAYWPDHKIHHLTMILQDPITDTIDTSSIEGVTVAQVVSGPEPTDGNWNIKIWNNTTRTVSVTLMSNYPFDFSLPHSVYLPIAIRAP